MGVLIFWMSANTGSTINEGLGIISSIKALLADAALALFGHAVDVSPVGHFVEYFIFGILLCNALRFSVPLPRAIPMKSISFLCQIAAAIHLIGW